MSHADDYYANYGGLSVDAYVERHIRGSASEMDRMRRTVALLPADVTSVLDVGAGHGVLLEELRAARGIAGIGVEITPAKVDYARQRGIDLRLGDAARLAFAERSVDAVVSCEVLEHLPFGVYEQALAEFARVARRWVLVSVPYDERRRFVRCPYCSARVNPDYHFRSFAPGAMRKMAEALPGFALRLETTLGRQRRRPALVDWGRQFIEAWPWLLVCASCGYRASAAPADAAPHQPSSAAAAPVADQRAPREALARKVAGWLPARSRPIWMVGLFERTGQAAEPTHE